MTIFTEFRIGSEGTINTLIPHIYDIDINSTASESNAVSSIRAKIENYMGLNKNNFSPGMEFEIKSEKDVNPPTSVLLKGYINDVNFSEREQQNYIQITGKDYTSRLQDVSVEPTVFNNLTVGSITRSLINEFASGITFNNVITSGALIKNISFKHISLFDALKQIADYGNNIFWVDNNKDLHFIEKGSGVSVQTFDNNNSLSFNFKTTDRNLYNQVYVYGARQIAENTQSFTAPGTDGGSVYQLNYRPREPIIVDVAGVRKLGGILGIVNIPSSGQQWLVHYESGIIVFTSGIEAGNNIPSTGTTVVIDYGKEIPLLKYGEDTTSIAKYGEKVKVINDNSITTSDAARDIVTTTLDLYSNPRTEGIIKSKGVFPLTAGQTITVNSPNNNINNQLYQIIEVNYALNSKDSLKETTTTVKVGDKTHDINDTIKDILLQLKQLQAKDISATDILSRLLTSAGSFGFSGVQWQVKSRSIAGENLIWGNSLFGIWGDYKWGLPGLTSFVIGNDLAGRIGVNTLGISIAPWVILRSGGY
jgi:hypothetical protein